MRGSPSASSSVTDISEERPIVRRKRRSKCVVSRVDFDFEGARGLSETTSDLDFIVSDGASPEGL